MVPAPRRSDRRSDGIQIQCHGAWIWLDLMLPAAATWQAREGRGVQRRVRGGGDMERSAAVFGDGSGVATT
jgi:hypothetical protein